MRYRHIAAFAVAAVIGTPVPAQDLAQKITYSGPTGSAKTVLADISKIAQYPFETSPQTANEVIFVSVKDVTLADLLKKIAEATGSEWAKETNGYRLVRSATLLQTQAKEDLSARAEQLKAGIAKATEALDKQPTYTKEAAQKGLEPQTNKTPDGSVVRIFGGTDGLPGGRALMRLARMIGPESLASIAPGTRVVFSSAPTRMQYAIRGNVQQVLQNLVAEQQIYAQASAATPPPDPSSSKPAFEFNIVNGPAEPFKTRLTKAIVVAERFGRGPQINLQLKVADEQGNFVSRGHLFVGSALTPPKTTAPSEKAIEISAETKEFAKLMAGQRQFDAEGRAEAVSVVFALNGDNLMLGGSQSDTTRVSKEWRDKLSQPEKYDPVALIANDLLVGLAGAKSTNVVACLPDSVVPSLARRIIDVNLTPTTFAENLKMMDVRVTDAEGWTTVAPVRPVDNYSTRLDRAALGVLLRASAATGIARLDDIALYMLKQPVLANGPHFEDRLLSLLCSNTGMGGFGNLEARMMYRLYGTLSLGQKQTMWNTGRLPIGPMNSQQKAMIHSMVFDSMSGPAINYPKPGEAQGQLSTFRRVNVVDNGSGPQVFNYFGDDDLAHERTEALPNGLTGDGFILFSGNNQAAVLASRSNAGGQRIFNAAELGGHQATKTTPALAAFAGNQPDYDQYRTGTLTRMSFNFQLAPHASMQRALNDFVITPGSQVQSFDGLPGAFKNEVEAARKNFAEKLGNLKIGSGGGGVLIGKGGTPPPARS